MRYKCPDCGAILDEKDLFRRQPSVAPKDQNGNYYKDRDGFFISYIDETADPVIVRMCIWCRSFLEKID